MWWAESLKCTKVVDTSDFLLGHLGKPEYPFGPGSCFGWQGWCLNWRWKTVTLLKDKTLWSSNLKCLINGTAGFFQAFHVLFSDLFLSLFLRRPGRKKPVWVWGSSYSHKYLDTKTALWHIPAGSLIANHSDFSIPSSQNDSSAGIHKCEPALMCTENRGGFLWNQQWKAWYQCSF